MKNTFKAFAFLIVFFSSTLLAQDLKIAAATNLTHDLKALVKEFQKEHSKDAISVSFNYSGKLYAQIIQNAPFDLFISADITRPKKLYDEKITPFKEEVYAKGVLVLWSENLKIDSLEVLKDPKIKRMLWLILNWPLMEKPVWKS